MNRGVFIFFLFLAFAHGMFLRPAAKPLPVTEESMAEALKEFPYLVYMGPRNVLDSIFQLGYFGSYADGT